MDENEVPDENMIGAKGVPIHFEVFGVTPPMRNKDTPPEGNAVSRMGEAVSRRGRNKKPDKRA